ncbi:hypothetical protein GCM10028807_42040 [Spirosoma daeguense]
MNNWWLRLVYVLMSLFLEVAVKGQSVIINDVKFIERYYVNDDLPPSEFKRGDTVVTTNYRYNNLLIYLQSPSAHPTYSYEVRKLFKGAIATRDSVLFLPNLPNGEFIIHIRDLTNSSIQPIQLKLVIESPLWLRWWFLPMMFLYGLLFISAGLYLLYRYRLRQFLRLQRVRDRIARDLHDDMGSYLSSISILSQTAHRSVIKDPAKTQATLERIGKTARQIMDSMGDIVWSINPSHDSMEQVVGRMTDVASSLFTTGNELENNVAFQLDIATDVRQMSLPAETRRDFFLIYKEAITNVARYAKASRVGVKLWFERNQLYLKVEDNGCGFDPENPIRQNPSGGNGLRNMHARASLLNGTLTIESTQQKGTSVLLRFPI